MSTTDVILKEKIEGLGAEADVVSVRRGFARNFLIPTGKAYEATNANLRHVEALKKARALREAEEQQAAEKYATKLRKAKITLELAIGEHGKAFGSITTNDIAEAVKAKTKIELDRHAIQLEKPIKSTGTFDIPVKLHSEIEVSLSVTVKTPEAKASKPETEEEQKEKDSQ